MAPITWNPELSVGHDQIDDQHRWLIDKVNTLDFLAGEGSDRNFTIRTLNELLSYASEHFRTEEALFRETDFPEAAAHMKEHERFTAQVIAFRTRFVTVGEDILPQLVEFLSGWLETHLRDVDRLYVPYIGNQPA